jgi:hypothetical protein
MRVLNQNVNTVDLVKSLEKKSKTSHSYHSGHIDGDIIQNHEQKREVKISGKPRFYGQHKLFLSTLPFSPWAVSATWLHVGGL